MLSWKSGLQYLTTHLIALQLSKMLTPALIQRYSWRTKRNGASRRDNTAGPGGALGTAAGGNFAPNASTSSDSYATGDQRLPKVLIPMIRRTFPELITNDIVGVQPMSGPVGLAFALRYAYQSQELGSGIDRFICCYW